MGAKCMCIRDCWVRDPKMKKFRHYVKGDTDTFEECPKHFELIGKGKMKVYEDETGETTSTKQTRIFEGNEGEVVQVHFDDGTVRKFFIENGDLGEEIKEKESNTVNFLEMTEEELLSGDGFKLDDLKAYTKAAYDVKIHPNAGLEKTVDSFISARDAANIL